MKTILFTILASSLFLNTALAQTHTPHPDVVESVKASLLAASVDLSGPCGAFQITKRVAWLLRSEGTGLLSKPGGNNCDGYSVDYLTYIDGSGVDILGDAGNTNSPGWSDGEPVGALLGRWRAPLDPTGGPAPVPLPPTTVPPSSPAADELLSRIRAIEQAVADIRQQNLVHETAEAAERADAKDFRNAVASVWKDRMVFLGKYILPAVGGIFAGWKGLSK